MTKNTLDFKNVVLPTIFEYLVIVLPVGFYVLMEAMHKGSMYFVSSPEWAIASIFLGFQSVFLYFKHLGESKSRPNFNFLGILILGLISITIISTINAYASIGDECDLENKYMLTNKVILRLSLLLISSLIFFLLVFASKVSKVD